MWSSFGWKAWTFCLFVEEHWHGVHIQIFFCVVCLHWNGTGIVFMRTPGLRSETSLVNQEQQAEFLFLSAIPVLFSDLFVRTWKSGQNRSCWQKPRFFFSKTLTLLVCALHSRSEFVQQRISLCVGILFGAHQGQKQLSSVWMSDPGQSRCDHYTTSTGLNSGSTVAPRLSPWHVLHEEEHIFWRQPHLVKVIVAVRQHCEELSAIKIRSVWALAII